MFDETRDAEIRAAFSYEISAQNKKQQRLKMSAEAMNKLDMEDSYAVGSMRTQFASASSF